ncbi:MAG: RHS repeat-associated core domain-containing protein, partial [Kiritimatiellae bacterium]|nr:RHS repeat-associated core domain-containing protein [Kiritimatiellia bacterium]
SVPGGGEVSYGYCAWNGLESAATNAAFTVSKEYDVLDRVTNVTYAARDGTPLYSIAYAYEPDGLVTQRVVAAASGAVTNSYAYDGLMRLTFERDSGGNFAANTYDLCGNRLAVVTSVGTSGHTYTHNRRDADTYDAGGRVTRTVNGRGQLLDLAWNLQRQLVSVSTNGVFAESYAYDPLGRRVSTTDISGTVYHAYDGIHCVADLAPDGRLLRAYTWGAGVDNLLAVTFYNGESTNTLSAVTDPLGTVHALVDASGTITVSYTYDSWGNLLSASGSDSLIASLRFTWQGREYSHAAGLYNFRARWYDPAAGRWFSKDPIGLEGGLNLYEAFGNNPVCFRDPLGEFSYKCLLIGAGVGALAGGAAGALIGAGGALIVGGEFSILALIKLGAIYGCINGTLALLPEATEDYDIETCGIGPIVKKAAVIGALSGGPTYIYLEGDIIMCVFTGGIIGGISSWYSGGNGAAIGLGTFLGMVSGSTNYLLQGQEGFVPTLMATDAVIMGHDASSYDDLIQNNF